MIAVAVQIPESIDEEIRRWNLPGQFTNIRESKMKRMDTCCEVLQPSGEYQLAMVASSRRLGCSISDNGTNYMQVESKAMVLIHWSKRPVVDARARRYWVSAPSRGTEYC